MDTAIDLVPLIRIAFTVRWCERHDVLQGAQLNERKRKYLSAYSGENSPKCKAVQHHQPVF